MISINFDFKDRKAEGLEQLNALFGNIDKYKSGCFFCMNKKIRKM